MFPYSEKYRYTAPPSSSCPASTRPMAHSDSDDHTDDAATYFLTVGFRRGPTYSPEPASAPHPHR